VVELVLTVPTTGVPPVEVDWCALPGVVEASGRDEAIVLRVAREHSDAVLLTALQHHWSVDGLARAAVGRGSRRVDSGRAAL
jgi:hypothetical protein